MLIDPDSLDVLCCPIDKAPLRVMAPGELAGLNAAIAQRQAWHACGDPVAGPIEAGLVSTSGPLMYRVLDGVPVLLPELGIGCGRDAAGAVGAGFRRGEDASTDERWETFSHFWNTVRPPLRPGQADVDMLQRLVGAHVAGTGTSRPSALLLGVTPEIATMRWPGGTRVLALDFSAGMIRNVWQARDGAHSQVARANWTTMPVRDAACDIVIGDGNLTSLSYPAEYLAFAGEARRVLKDTGTLVLRLFARPERPEPLDTIFSDLRNGRIATSSYLPWRIAMVLHGNLATGVRTAGVWETWCAHVPDPDALFRALGWPPQALAALEWTRGAEYTMRFPTVGEVEELMSPGFSLVGCRFPDYEGGERYPTVVLEPRKRT